MEVTRGIRCEHINNHGAEASIRQARIAKTRKDETTEEAREPPSLLGIRRVYVWDELYCNDSHREVASGLAAINCTRGIR